MQAAAHPPNLLYVVLLSLRLVVLSSGGPAGLLLRCGARRFTPAAARRRLRGTSRAEAALRAAGQELRPRGDALQADRVAAGERRDGAHRLCPRRALAEAQVDQPVALGAVGGAQEGPRRRLAHHLLGCRRGAQQAGIVRAGGDRRGRSGSHRVYQVDLP